MDYSSYTLEELDTIIEEVSTERQRRFVLASTPSQIDSILINYLTASGQEPGDSWVQPMSSQEAYPLGWEVSQADKLWVSTVSGNLLPPGEEGWEEVVTEEP